MDNARSTRFLTMEKLMECYANHNKILESIIYKIYPRQPAWGGGSVVQTEVSMLPEGGCQVRPA